MKKNLILTFLVLGLVACMQPCGNAQEATAAEASIANSSVAVTLIFMEEQLTTALAAHLASPSIDAAVYRDLIEQGMHYDPIKDHIYLNTRVDGKYSKAEIVNKATGQLLYSGQLSDSGITRHMTTIDPGTYLIVLTNEAGEIDVEEVNVVNLRN